ncbi:uncharacterized protein LOC142637150 isoform X1 [Castanea sativa]|uniref:uncharacterized protein LOC142637150 isoform X1 n=1 Tax=Castanea sativa TaxID=21020 RepID=UPI003F649A9E
MTIFFDYFTGKNKHIAIVATAAPLVIFGSILAGWALANRSCKTRKPMKRFSSKTLNLATLHGGKLAYQKLVDYHDAQVDAEALRRAETELDRLLEEEQLDFYMLQQRAVAKLEMSGKEEHAVEKLEKALEKMKKENKQLEAYETDMLLVEMLIYKGDFEKANKCECLKHEEISDARRPLYKAIIHIMLDRPTGKKEAKKCWEDFMEIQRHFEWPPCSNEIQAHKVITDFNEFEREVKLLKDDIAKAHAKKTQA